MRPLNAWKTETKFNKTRTIKYYIQMKPNEILRGFVWDGEVRVNCGSGMEANK